MILVLLGLATLPVPSAVGQNLESFDIETIVDPLALRLQEGERYTWLDFFGTYVQTGYAEDFQAGARFTGTGVAFVDWLSTYIHHDLQFSGRVTGFEQVVGNVTGPVRVELAAARYFGVDDVKDVEDEAETSIKRLQISVTRNQGHSALERSIWSLEYDIMDPGASRSPGPLNPPFDGIVRWRLAYVESDRYRLSGGSEPATVELPEEYQLSLEARTRTSPDGWAWPSTPALASVPYTAVAPRGWRQDESSCGSRNGCCGTDSESSECTVPLIGLTRPPRVAVGITR